MKIVIVDSSRVGLKIISSILKNQGHETHVFTDGKEAFDFIRSDLDVNLLLTGLELPSMTGFELCWDVHLLTQRGRQIYIMAMSSNHDESKLIETLDSGADDFISKPPQERELLARLRVAQRMQAMQEELIKLASLDSLTGILNRRAFFDRSEMHCQNAEDGKALTAIMFDIDHFKRVNDVFGHDIGDKALTSVVNTAQKEFGLFARMGGEEFAMLLPGIAKDEAMDIAEQLRLGVKNLRIDTPKKPLKITCSYGVSEWQEGDTIEGLLKRADLALYMAKESGRNQVRFGDRNIKMPVPERSSKRVEICYLS